MVVLRGRDPARSKYVGVRPGHRVAGTVHSTLARDLHAFSPTEKIGVLQSEAGGVGAAGATEGDAGAQRPNVLGDDPDVDFSIAVAHRHDVRVIDVVEQAQRAL